MSIGPINLDTMRRAREIGMRGVGILRERLDSVGDGSGTKEMATTANEYLIFPASSVVYVLDNIQVIIKDDGNMPWDEFAAMGAALGSGILLDTVEDKSSVITQTNDLLDNKPIVDNSEFLGIGTVSLSPAAAGQSILTCKINFRDLLGYPILLRGEHGDGLRFTTQDDLSSLQSLQVWANGIVGI